MSGQPQLRERDKADDGLVDVAVKEVREAPPKLRVWPHLIATACVLASGVVLIAFSPHATTTLGSAFFVGVSLLFAVSAIHHRGAWSNRTREVLRRFNQANIFPLIAGSRAPRRAPSEALTAATTALGIATVDALDWAFAGGRCELVKADGTSRLMAVHQWAREASPTDHVLFVRPCLGPTLDVGCGPGRLTAAVTERGFHALGIDISAEAVRQTRARGGAAVHQDVFAELSSPTAWQHVLLADGNIGLGGDPVRLLIRVAELLAGGGSALVEVAGPGIGTVHEQVRLRVGERLSPPFSWATVGVDTIGALAGEAGLTLTRLDQESGRYVATLEHAKDHG